MSTTSYNQAIEDAAKWHDDTATLAAENDDIRDAEIHRICARAIRALRQPASDTPDPRDEVIRELRDVLREARGEVLNYINGLALSATDPSYETLRRIDAALSKGEGAK